MLHPWRRAKWAGAALFLYLTSRSLLFDHGLITGVLTAVVLVPFAVFMLFLMGTVFGVKAMKK